MTPAIQRLVPILLVAVLCQCGAPQPPQCRSVPGSSRVPAASLITEARQNWAILASPSRSSEWTTARTRYDAAVAKLFDQLRCGPGDWNSRAAALGTRMPPLGKEDVDLTKLDAVFPASEVRDSVVTEHHQDPGIGVPLVGWIKTTPIGIKREPYLLPVGLPYNITTALTFDRSGTPVWRFSKRWLQNDIKIGNTTHALAADWTAPNEFYWHMCDLDDLTIQNVILPDRFSQETGLYFLQPYDPKKIPIVFIHGLVSSPDAFKNMINDLAPNPWFRERYQIWLYNYPTGNPWLYSSMNFRNAMRKATAYARSKGDSTNLNKMVLVGHSMGGLIAHSSVVDPKDALYKAIIFVPLDKLKISQEQRKMLQDSMLYQPLSEPSRVVFLAVPHRGSPMATMRISNWISSFIRLPKTLTVNLIDSSMIAVGLINDEGRPKTQLPNSINSLSPKSRANIALNKIPLPNRITFHSVIGDRGKGNTPNSSDGVVPYWSSHITPVASELIVPSN
ncbi:MAG: alpha/beta hydrolase, partial [Gloeobacteraceae cyanobacterium ES-bin-144]|nr:alpha/beta hydrolase [Verrucomicrobiales bacterium]